MSKINIVALLARLVIHFLNINLTAFDWLFHSDGLNLVVPPNEHRAFRQMSPSHGHNDDIHRDVLIKSV